MSQGFSMGDMSAMPSREEMNFAQEHKVIFLSGQGVQKDPDVETYWDMLTFAFCPTITLLSITTLIILADLAMFITELTLGLDTTANKLLAINSLTLIRLGANSVPQLMKGEVYRLIAPIFLHVNFLHIFGNLLATFIFVYRFEYTFGVVRTTIIYLLAGITANIFSSAVNRSSVKAGASTSLYGILGAIIVYVIINWRGMNAVGSALKCRLCLLIVMIIVFILIFTPGADQIDYFGHIGGFISGATLVCIHPTIRKEKPQNIARIILGVFFILFCIGSFLGFYLQK